jgi:predicted ABC-type ATPase
MKKLYILAGPNGSGKTTTSYTILPDIFECKEFVNSDEIARGLSPFNPNSVALTAGRLMLGRIHQHLKNEETFAIETTLATFSYQKLIEEAQAKGYIVTLLFLYLDSVDLAIKRVETRVKEGGHDIPEEVIRRRYQRGLTNFFNLYIPIVDDWIFVNNSGITFEIIATGAKRSIHIKNKEIWTRLKKKYYEH